MIDPGAVGAATPVRRFTWDDRDTILYALGIGADQSTLEFVTENSDGVAQRVLPTYGVIVADPSLALALVGDFDPADAVHGAQGVTVRAPLPPAGSVDVVAQVVRIVDKGPGGNAIIDLSARARDADTGRTLVETTSTVVVRRAGGFGGAPASRQKAEPFPDRSSDIEVTQVTSSGQALLYRLSGDRNPLHSDPHFAARAGFSRPILHGLCTYGFAGRALLAELCGDDDSRFRSMDARFTAPVLPGEVLTTHIWRTGDGEARFRTSAHGADDGESRIALDDGRVVFDPA